MTQGTWESHPQWPRPVWTMPAGRLASQHLSTTRQYHLTPDDTVQYSKLPVSRLNVWPHTALSCSQVQTSQAVKKTLSVNIPGDINSMTPHYHFHVNRRRSKKHVPRRPWRPGVGSWEGQWIDSTKWSRMTEVLWVSSPNRKKSPNPFPSGRHTASRGTTEQTKRVNHESEDGEVWNIEENNRTLYIEGHDRSKKC